MYLISTRKENPRHKYLGEKKSKETKYIRRRDAARVIILQNVYAFVSN